MNTSDRHAATEALAQDCIAVLERAIEAARNSNQDAENFVVMAANAAWLYEALTDCVRRLRSCAEIAGNADWAIDVMCERFDAALALARGESA